MPNGTITPRFSLIGLMQGTFNLRYYDRPAVCFIFIGSLGLLLLLVFQVILAPNPDAGVFAACADAAAMGPTPETASAAA